MYSIPKFLTEIENEIQKKLKRVQKSGVLVVEREKYCHNVLEVYREAFGLLLDQIVTYRPLLQQIKHAYDDAIAAKDQFNKIVWNCRDLKFIKLVEKCDKHEKEVKELGKENEKLKKDIDGFKKSMDELQLEMYTDHNDLLVERNARYELYHENVKLHMKLKDLDRTDEPSNGSQDPFILRMSLNKTREELTRITRELKLLKDDYYMTVPRREFDKIEIDYSKLEKEMKTLKAEFNEYRDMYHRLLDSSNSTKEDMLDLKDKLAQLEREGTPRPQWDVCSSLVKGGSERWRTLTGGLSSQKILHVVLREFGQTGQIVGIEYFEGLGSDPVVPPYLQYEGKVRNLRLSRRELSVLISDIWLNKLEKDSSMAMQDFVSKYFTDRYQQMIVRAEWAYNLCSGCEQMLDDPQIKLFWGILNGTLHQDIFISLRNEWDNLKRNAVKFSKHVNQVISMEEMMRATRMTFPMKSDVDIRSIQEAIRRQLKLKMNTFDVNAEKLFLEPDEGFDRTDLAKELYRQRQIAQDKYIHEIIQELRGKDKANRLISVDELKRAFAVVDPHIDHIRMEYNVRWAFSDKKSDLKLIIPIPLKTIALKLSSGNIERAGPRSKGRINALK